jgi:V8-like Glu-specific endopeptidase
MGVARAGLTRFIGERRRPARLEELAERRPHLGTGVMPAELLEMQRRSTLLVAGGERRPNVAVTKTDDTGGHTAKWRIDITLQEEQRTVVPLLKAVRAEPDVYRSGMDEAVGYSGHRPEWIDMFYFPRGLSQHGHPMMRRRNGRSVRPLWVFGPDDRRLYRDTSYPWGCIGSIASSAGGGSGSGVLVGRNMVATAGHLVPWDGGWMKFVPDDYLAQGSLYGANVYSYALEARGYNTNQHVAGYDWAILKLDQPLGDMIGYMGYNSYSDDWQDLNIWTVVGYPSGAGPMWQGSISINDDDGDSNDGQELESETADVTGGNSGGPIFAWWGDDPRIIGIVSGEETEYVFPVSSHQDNVFAGGQGLYNLIAWGRSNW